MAAGGVPIYNKIIAPAKSDTVDQADGVWDAIYVSVAGNLVFVDQGGNAVTLVVVAGTTLPLRGKRINNGSTTATVFLLYQV